MYRGSLARISKRLFLIILPESRDFSRLKEFDHGRFIREYEILYLHTPAAHQVIPITIFDVSTRRHALENAKMFIISLTRLRSLSDTFLLMIFSFTYFRILRNLYIKYFHFSI